MYRTYETEIAGRKLKVEVGRVAELASGAAMVYYGDTVLLCTATASEKPRDGIDFFPLSIDYEEKLYAVGKIPGGFLKREGKQSEKATLTCRLIDRPMRPLFPKDYRNDVGLVCSVLSVDQDCSPEVTAMIGAAICLGISDIPFNGPVGSTNIGLINGEFIINPTNDQKVVSDLDLTVSSTRDKVMMIEAGANVVPNDTMFDAIMLADKENKKIVEFIDSIVKVEGKEKHSYEKHEVNKEVYEFVVNTVGEGNMEEAVFTDFKQIRDERMTKIKEDLVEKISAFDDEEKKELYLKELSDCVYKFEKTTVRRMILKDKKRPDGRAVDQIRQLSAEIEILPRTHGSAIFKRGQTQVLTVATLGAVSDAQRLDGLDENETSKRYMHHYNFPSYSVGETRPSRGPGRREIGHGALAERALVPVLPNEEEFSYAIRLVSEVVSSNGSTSQASVCASSLALMDAGVPISAPVAGISVGLVTDENSDDYLLLTDIQGLEDFFGDMDFKVAGTKDGITAIQMDIKINGLTPEMIKSSLEQTYSARMFILDEIMNKCIETPKKEISKYAPKIKMIQIPIDKIADVIGARGKTIKKILETSGVEKIDTDDEGKIFIVDTDSAKVEKAIEIIKGITLVPEIGMEFDAKVVKITTFGAFVEYAPEKEGLVHISQIANERIANVEDVLSVDQIVHVKVVEIDDQGRVKLSMKACL